MAHSFIHSPNHDRRRRCRRQGDVSEGRQAERECDRHCREHHHRHQSDEENEKVDVAERDQNRAQQIEHAANAQNESDGAAGQFPVANRDKTQDSEQGHKTKSDRQGGRPPHIGNVERGSRDE